MDKLLKTPFLVIGFCLLIGMVSCSKSDDDATELAVLPSSSEIVLLKIHKETYEFLGATTYTFPVAVLPNDSVPLYKEYEAPADYGSLAIFYHSENYPIFEGSIVWMAAGSVSIPDTLYSPNNFAQLEVAADLPDTSQFQVIHKFIWNEVPEYGQIWNAVDQLEIVHQYLEAGKKISLFEYARSAGTSGQDVYWYLVLNK